MCKNLMTLLLVLFTMQACNNVSTKVEGHLNEEGVDSLMVYAMNVENPKDREIKKVALKNGTFNVDLNDSALLSFTIYPIMKKNADGSMPAYDMTKMIHSYLVPGQNLVIDGSLSNYKLSGGDFYVAFQKACDSYKDATDAYNQEYKNYVAVMSDKASDKEAKNAARKKISEARELLVKKQLAYVKANPTEDVALMLLLDSRADNVDELMKTIDEKVKQGVFAPLYKKYLKDKERRDALNKAKEKIQPGKVAPAFTLKDENDKDVSLADFKGKYVVLDFWGTWCGWCVKGIPSMKKTYEKYQKTGKFEIISIDCGDTKDKWKKAIKTHEMSWVNVYKPNENKLTSNYAISGYPTKILIDPKGNIEKVFVGESEEFYKYIDNLMKK